jgi:hypothetical protein
MILRCPCRKCLIDPICKTYCPKFDEFISPIDKATECFVRLFEWIDDLLGDRTWSERVFEYFGEKTLSPIFFFVINNVFGIDADPTKPKLFDDRYTTWNNWKKDQ